MDILSQTVGREIASCCEKSYEYLGLEDAGSLLFLKSSSELMGFAKERGWIVNVAEKRIYFNQKQEVDRGFGGDLMAERCLGYANELEKIV